jgi:sugar (pentulose or hexulose) kinase
MVPEAPLFLTLDVGTTAVKAGLFDHRGAMVASASREYALETPSSNIVELDAEVYWNTSLEALREVLAASGEGAPGKVVSIGVCSQGETLICLDGAGNPLRKAIVWMDNRAQEETEELRKHFGHLPQTGQTDWDPSWPAAKLLWLKRNEEACFQGTERFVLVEDFVNYRLTGTFAGDYALYSSSYLLDIDTLSWVDPVLDYLGVNREQLVTLVDSGEIIGEVTPEVARILGIPQTTKVVSGAMDLAAALVGAGNIEPGQVTEITGAAEIMCNTLSSVPETRLDTIAVQRHARKGSFLSIGWCPSGGMSLRWFRDTFSADTSYDDLTALAAQKPPGSEGLVFFPYQSGPGTLDLPQHIRGGWYGLELNHTAGHFVRAILESLAYVLRQNLSVMQTGGLEYEEIRSIGGGASSGVWNQIKADVTGKRIATMECPEAASLGVAVLSATALGVYASLPEAAGNMVRRHGSVEPDPRTVERYEAEYRRYVDLQQQMLAGLSR